MIMVRIKAKPGKTIGTAQCFGEKDETQQRQKRRGLHYKLRTCRFGRQCEHWEKLESDKSILSSLVVWKLFKIVSPQKTARATERIGLIMLDLSNPFRLRHHEVVSRCFEWALVSLWGSEMQSESAGVEGAIQPKHKATAKQITNASASLVHAIYMVFNLLNLFSCFWNFAWNAESLCPCSHYDGLLGGSSNFAMKLCERKSKARVQGVQWNGHRNWDTSSTHSLK